MPWKSFELILQQRITLLQYHHSSRFYYVFTCSDELELRSAVPVKTENRKNSICIILFHYRLTEPTRVKITLRMFHSLLVIRKRLRNHSKLRHQVNSVTLKERQERHFLADVSGLLLCIVSLTKRFSICRCVCVQAFFSSSRILKD